MAKDIDSGKLGAVTHAALAIAGLIEGCQSRSKFRRFVAGCVVGWHVYATFYHLKSR